MAILGHNYIISRLSWGLPRTTLFLGPRSVGKWTTAEYLRYKLHFWAEDVLRVNFLSMGAARDVVAFAGTAPLGERKLVIIRLDNASKNAQAALLKTLEQAHQSVSFILIATKEPLDTIRSRALTFNFRLLTVDQVQEILVERKKVKPEAARAAAVVSYGQVQTAIDALEPRSERALVLQVVNAFILRSPAALDAVASAWTEEATALLITWCIEARTRTWTIFSEDDVENLRPDIPMRILKALTPDVRPKLVIRANLAAIIREN